MGKSIDLYKFLTFLGAPAGTFFPAQNHFWILGKPIDFYKLLTVLGAPTGAFFSAQKSLFDFGGCSGVHLCHRIIIFGGLLGNLGYLENWLISLLSVPGQ